jgi:hypothetical protein
MYDGCLATDGRVVVALGPGGIGLATRHRIQPGSRRDSRHVAADGGRYFSAGLDGVVIEWDAELAVETARLVVSDAMVTGLAVGVDCCHVATLAGRVTTWSTGSEPPPDLHYGVPVWSLAGNGSHRVAGLEDGTIGNGPTRIRVSDLPLRVVALFQRTLAYGCRNGDVTVGELT